MSAASNAEQQDPWGAAAVLVDGTWMCVWCSKPCADHAETHTWETIAECSNFYDFCHCLKPRSGGATP